MLSDEEKYAIDYLKIYIERDVMYENRHYNLIEKQSKEIEENKKYLVNLTHEQYIKLVEQIRSEINKEWRDVIKAKIEELDKEEKEALKGTKGQDRYAIKQEYMYKRSGLQSLLEKE